MREVLPAHDVPDYRASLGRVHGTEPKDRHVAAAAVACAPSHLLTWNLRDFDGKQLAALHVTLIDPDTFLCGLYDERPALIHAVTARSFGFVRQGHQRRAQPAPTWEDYLTLLATRGAPNALNRFAERLRRHRPVGQDLPDMPGADNPGT
jgi:hypothetical protein